MRNTPQVRAVVFDLDGTSLNTEDLYYIVLSELLHRRGKEFVPELRHAMMGKPSKISMQIMLDWHSLSDSIDQLGKETREIFVPLLETQLRLMPGKQELLEYLSARQVPCGIATSSRRQFVDDTLGRLGLLSYYSVILTADDVRDGKPHPEIYLTAADALGIAPAEMLVFEDSATGCAAAVASGAYTVAVPGEHSAQHEFPGAAFVAESLLDPRIWALLPP